MLACFAKGSGLDGGGSKRQRMRQPQDGCGGSYLANPTAEEEGQVYSHLATVADSLPTSSRRRVEEVMLGAGANGIAFVEGPRVSTAFEGDVAVYFQGCLSRGLSGDAESPAHDILQKYASGQLTPSGNNLNIGHLSGEFAVVIFDKLAGRVLAARDQRGTEPLFWGTSDFGESLLLSNDRRVLEKNCDDAETFPPGTLFSSNCGEVTGELTMLTSDDWGDDDDDKEEAWEEVDFLVQDGQEATATTTTAAADAADAAVDAAAADAADAEQQHAMHAMKAAERRWHASSTGGLTGSFGGLGYLSHCNRSWENLHRLNRVDSEEGFMRDSHEYGGCGSESAEKNLARELDRVSSKGEFCHHAAA